MYIKAPNAHLLNYEQKGKHITNCGKTNMNTLAQ